MLYWVVATKEPTKKEKEELEKSEELIMQPKIIVAKDDKTAAVKIATQAEELKGQDLDRITIIVRPF